MVFVGTHLVDFFHFLTFSPDERSRTSEESARKGRPCTVHGQRCQVYDRVAFQNHITFLKREAKREEGRCGKERESGEEPARYLRPSWGRKGRRLSSSSRQLSGALLLEVIVPIVKPEQRGMFGRLSGKHHFRAHSCRSPGT